MIPASSANIYLSYDHSILFLKKIPSHPGLKIEIDSGKSRITVLNQQEEKVLELHLPLCIPQPKAEQNLFEYTGSLPVHLPSYVILLIRAGQSALGYFEQGEILYHRVIRKYMVRKKQGRAQLLYQKRKIASSPGARIRMANTVAFFEEINTKLQEWFKSNRVDRIIYSCTPSLWSMLFRSRVSPPFVKKDERIIKIPLHLPEPLYKTLLYINRYSQNGICFITNQSGYDLLKLSGIPF